MKRFKMLIPILAVFVLFSCNKEMADEAAPDLLQQPELARQLAIDATPADAIAMPPVDISKLIPLSPQAMAAINMDNIQVEAYNGDGTPYNSPDGNLDLDPIPIDAPHADLQDYMHIIWPPWHFSKIFPVWHIKTPPNYSQFEDQSGGAWIHIKYGFWASFYFGYL